MSAQDRVVTSVRKLLEQAEKLGMEKQVVEQEPRNLPRATHLQSEIFRKFAIIDSLTGWQSETKKVIEKEVGLMKKQVGAEARDLKRMLIPKLLKTETVKKWMETENRQEEPFPYMNLPPEARKVILGNLTSPSDKLSLIEALPRDGIMMEWNSNFLKLEQSLSIILNPNKVGNYHSLEYQDLVKLSRAGDEIHGVVKNCFKQFISDTFSADFCDASDFCVGGDCKLMDISPADFALNPFPAFIEIKFSIGDLTASRTAKLERLRQIGNNIWYGFIVIQKMSARRTIYAIRDCLELMPHLRRLSVVMDLKSNLTGNADTFNHVQLPDLRQLQELDVMGDIRTLGLESSSIGQVGAKILAKYRHVITGFRTNRLISAVPSIPEPSGDMGGSHYPRLTAAYLVDECQSDAEPIVSKLKTFAGSALKTIDINVDYRADFPLEFQRLMCALSRFGETLEKLSVTFCSERSTDSRSNFGQLAALNFPKVKTLHVRNYPATWSVLLHFPALETLEISFSNEDGFLRSPNDCFAASSILDLSWNEREMCSSNVWKMLPFLKKIKIFLYIPPIDSYYDDEGEIELEVTRDRCLDYQQKFMARIHQEFQDQDVTIGGSVSGEILQVDDGGLIIKGDLSGNIIQEGNGRVMVGGFVKGNIEQRGDGKIFVGGQHDGTVIKTGNGLVDVNWGGLKQLFFERSD